MTSTDFKLFNFIVLCIILLGLASALRGLELTPPLRLPVAKTTPNPEPKLTYIPQFVLISFDGSRQTEIWKMIRLFKDEMRGAGKPINVTQFINTAYLLTRENKDLYQGPGRPRGTSNVGFSEDMDQLRIRVREINRAIADGDEIAIHTTGHFSGLNWSKEEWLQELASFDSILFGLGKLYPDAGLPRLHLSPEDVVGFRAPYLDHSPGLYEALPTISRMRYDSSEIGNANAWPYKDENGLWHIPLGMMEIGPYKKSILAMDYNLYARDSQAQDWIKKGTEAWDTIYNDTLHAFRGYFNSNYTGNRAPVLVGYHFEVWNDGVYWEVLKTFARETCGKPEVRCGTFKELVDYMDEYGVPGR